LTALLHKEPNTNERIAAHEFFVTLIACSIVIPMLIGSNSQIIADERIK
jgi:hypothetical protein